MILNLRRIGLCLLSLALLFSPSITPLYSQEITPFKEFFKGYEKVWEIPITETIGNIHTIDCEGDRFVIVTKIKANNYKYYLHDITGKLIWENDNMEIYPMDPPLSLSGNRMIMYKNIPQEKKPIPVVYDTEGNLLLELPEFKSKVRSSPTGRFFYSSADFFFKCPLLIANNNGEIIWESEPRLTWYAEALDDSLLVYDNPDRTEIIKITENGIVRQYSIYEKSQTDKYLCQLFPAPNGDFIAARFSGLLSMTNKDLKTLYNIDTGNKVYNIAFTDRSEMFCVYIFNLDNREHSFRFFSIDGKLIGETSMIFPEGYGAGGNMGFKGNIFISRFPVADRETLDRPRIKYFRSFVVRLSSDCSSIVSTAILENRIYSFGRFGDLLVVSDSTITGWSKKREE